MENDVKTLAVGIAFVVLYFLPGLVAARRKHRSVSAIGFVNFFFGWTVIGWFWAMIWSLTGNVRDG